MEDKKKVKTGIDYKNKMYRPNVFFNKAYQDKIETFYKSKGYNSFNKYVNDLVLHDVGIL